MAAATLRQKNSTLKPAPQPFDDDESWKFSTWAHRACLAGGCTTLIITLAKSIFLILTRTNGAYCLEIVLAAFLGYAMADLGSGIYHWAIDNYGSAQTPIFGSQIEGFLGHHQRPWVITQQHLARKLYILAASITAILFPINMLSTNPVLLVFVGVFAGCDMFSQLFHAWSHTPKGKLPRLVVALQDAGILLGRFEHAAHHHPPYNTNYCIVSGMWNRFLDKSKFFLGLEMAVFRVTGVLPRSWSDPTTSG